MAHAVIYIPGLEDDKTDKAQAFLLSFWRIYRLKPIYHPMLWSDKKSYAEKLESILEEVDDLVAKGNKVSLIGVSAAASMSINVYARRQKDISRVVCVCGKLKNPESVVASTLNKNPAFKGSLDDLDKSLSRLSKAELQRVLSLRPIRDQRVRPSDTIIDGALSGQLPTSGHGKSITYALTFGSHRIAKFFKAI